MESEVLRNPQQNTIVFSTRKALLDFMAAFEIDNANIRVYTRGDGTNHYCLTYAKKPLSEDIV